MEDVMLKTKYREMVEKYLRTKCKSINQLLSHKTFRERILKHRECALIFFGVVGIVLALIIYSLTWLIGLGNDNGNKVLQSSLTILALGLPIFFTLWLFRTHDVQQQIDKTQENTNNSSFFECARMLIAEDSLSKKTALEQLAYLKNETELDEKRIDHLTQHIDLSGKNLTDARLHNLDLSNTKLIQTDLTDANLEQVDLRGADLSEAILEKAILKGAIYNSKTIFKNTHFGNREARDKTRMIYKP